MGVGETLADPGLPRPTHGLPDLLVIAGDSRSKSEAAAIEEMTALTQQLRQLQPEWVYKKTDSVLRGHVMAELHTHMEVLGLHRTLLIPANPGLGRTILDGHYFLNGRPIHHSAFSIDPEFPVLSSDIQDMLHTRSHPVQIKKAGEPIPDNDISVCEVQDNDIRVVEEQDNDIIVGEVQDDQDLQTWAQRIPPDTLAAGAAGFFSALLDRQFPAAAKNATENHVFDTPLLFISGSTFDRSRNAIQSQQAAGSPVSYMPMNPDASWQDLIGDMLQKYGKAIVAIDPKVIDRSPQELRTMMATAIAGILKKTMPAEIIIEGGATAYAIFKEIRWQTFLPEQELAPGLIRMRVGETTQPRDHSEPSANRNTPGVFVTVKPGSYPWPDNISY
jgi:uncharacterized protein YgbK (DUF1537 family)